MYICTEGCYENPQDGGFVAEYSIDADEEIMDGPNTITCAYCGNPALCCDRCSWEQFCTDHGGSRSGEQVEEPFSNVEWIKKALV